jgi:hypothetical protein
LQLQKFETHHRKTRSYRCTKDAITESEGNNMAKLRIPWTPDEETKLLELKESGSSWDEIAKHLNKEFKHERPLNPKTNKPARRSAEGCKWHIHNIKKRKSPAPKTPKPKKEKPAPKHKPVQLEIPLNDITITIQSGHTKIAVFHTSKAKDTLIKAIADII